MAKATFAQIALAAGVSTATVERVLNARGGVREATMRKVIAAAQALDLQRILPKAHHGIFRIEVLMVRAETTFSRRLSKAFERVAATLDKTVQLQRIFLDPSRPEEIAARILTAPVPRAGLILCIPDHPLIGAALRQAEARGEPVVQVVTRASEGPAPFIGIDNEAAGRTAALYLARMAQNHGPIVALCDPIYHVHRARLRGFSGYFAEHPCAERPFLWTGFGRDDPAQIRSVLTEAIARLGPLGGIYNAGAGTRAVLDVLRQSKRPCFFVGHELNAYSSAALAQGEMQIVLDQDPESQARRATDWMLHLLALLPEPPESAPIRFITVTDQSL